MFLYFNFDISFTTNDLQVLEGDLFLSTCCEGSVDCE